MMKAIKFLFNNNTKKRSQTLLESVSKQQDELNKLREDYNELNTWYLDYYDMLNKLTGDMNAFVWRKNVNHEYIIANPNHCKNFFGIPDTTECLQYIRGKTDKDLIDEIYRDNGFRNTYGEICTLSDEYTVKKDETVHLLEAGIIDDSQVLLYLIKMPQHDKDGNVIGTNGIAWNFTSKSSFIMPLLNQWICNGKVETLHSNEHVFCYALQPGVQECDIFNHLCPYSREDQFNNSECEYATG